MSPQRSVLKTGVISCVVAAGIAGTVAGAPSATAAPFLAVSSIATGLSHPWDIVTAPDGTALVTERAGRFVAIRPGQAPKTVRADLSALWVHREAGLMGLAVDPGFAQNRRIYSCQAEKAGTGSSVAQGAKIPQDVGSVPLPWPNTGQQVTVASWRVSPDWSSMQRERTVLAGIPLNAGGRHAGCGLAAASDGTLWIGTGDNATAWYPQSRQSLGGKVLHVNAATGRPAAGNPDPASPIATLGHRNVQGIAVQPGSGRVYSIEQGTSVDDELNLIRPGANYGYRPDRAPLIYDESVAMTDPTRVPGAVGSIWKSGNPTIATPALQFLPSSGWGEWNGAVVIAAQKAKKLVVVKLDDSGTRVVRVDEALADRYGRLRALAVDRDGSLLVGTDAGTDQILRIRPGA